MISYEFFDKISELEKVFSEVKISKIQAGSLLQLSPSEIAKILQSIKRKRRRNHGSRNYV